MIDDGVSLLLAEALFISMRAMTDQEASIQVPLVPDDWKRERRDLLSVVPIDHSSLSVLML
jgi:hypothetical protein